MVENGFAVCRDLKANPTALSILSVCVSLLTLHRLTLSPSVGINYESSFEAEILKNTKHCQIWGYDFSVKSFGPEIPANLQARTHFKAYALGGEDNHGPEDDPPMYTLETLMKMNGTSQWQNSLLFMD